MGNLGSILNMFKRIGHAAMITNDLKIIRTASKLLLPGVGAFDHAMRRINESGLRELLTQKVLGEKTPVLGICLGMQLLTNSSDEGTLPGLGWIPGRTKRFPDQADLKVPHMGWNVVKSTRESPLTIGLTEEARFYFVHSYYVQVEDEENSILKTHYGITFDAAIQRENIFGAQFHPEKSHKFGMQLLKNFGNI